ncbi:MAG: hypothetical protein HY689_04080 [Chloroflexi bacterium]|nr:hypothetical protein [Chloroflexota bacterium]
MQRNLVVTAVVAVLMAGFVLVYLTLAPAQVQPMDGMSGMAADGPTVPPVEGFAAGQEIRFLHTEASDPQVARMLTDMMGSPVLVVPSLAQAPEAMLANVYVFTNGARGDGPMGFQPDVFDRPPGDPGYSPLRALNLVTWKNAQAARVLMSASEVQEAEAQGAVTIQRPGVVVNMPFLIWPGGQR